jgi:hypothetical protein
MQYDERPSGTAVAGVSFAGTMLILVGAFQIINGIAAISNDQFYALTRHYFLSLDVSQWGWIHLILGILVALSGFALFSGKPWAAIVALALAMLSAINNFFFLPHYPFWSILIIAADVWIIWSLTRPGVLRMD